MSLGRRYRGNSNSYKRRNLINDYEGVLMELGVNRDGLAMDTGPIKDGRVVRRAGAPTEHQLSLSF